MRSWSVDTAAVFPSVARPLPRIFCTHLLQICDFYHFIRHGQKGRRGDYPNCQEDGQNGAEEERGEKHEKNKCLALPAASRQGSREFTAKLGANGL